jgi:hypothetical protein
VLGDSRQYDAALTFVAAKSVVWRFIDIALDKHPGPRPTHMIDSDGMPVPYSKQPRGLATLARPVRKIPYKLQLLNPERRMPRSPRMTLPPLLESTSLGNLSSMSGFSASSVGSMHASASLPMILHRVDAEVLRSRYDDPKFYRRDHLTIWGGADYQLHLKKKIKVKSKYLSFLPEQNVDAAERARQRKLESVKKLMRESARIFQKAGARSRSDCLRLLKQTHDGKVVHLRLRSHPLFLTTILLCC